ncbi:hydrolase [Streptacidiphilus sp. N1-3]|uniref:Hydrolase n=1 Tax=Streptacidiphilus alkalitolerans TaxID=3342712 RepID=A0ABV6XBH7_9ACTN
MSSRTLTPRHSRRWAARAAAVGLVAAMAATAVPAVSFGAPAAGGGPHSTPVRGLTLPKPTGPHQVGIVDLHLVDAARPNPWTASPAYRELMASVYYPARDTAGRTRAAQFPAGTAAAFDQLNAGELGLPSGLVDWASTRTWAYREAPAATAPRGGFPVLLFSPGAGDPRGWDSTVAEDLASRGFVVVTIDPTYDASGVEFPGGRVETSVLPQLFAQAQQDGTVGDLLRKVVSVRADDATSVLDTLGRIAAGHAPAGAALPAGLAGSLDLGRVGMYGQSAGGSTAAQAMYQDRRIKAGIDLDGILEYAGEPTPGAPLMSSAANGIDRPFLLMGSQSADGESLASDPSWRAFYDNERGWVRDVTMAGSRHVSYTDAESLVPQLARALGPTVLPPSTVTDDVGTIRPARAVSLEETYVAAFFDRWLRGGHDPILDGTSPTYPEMLFQH